MRIVIVCFPVCEVINFVIYLNFLNVPFSYTTKKVRTNILVPKERIELLRQKSIKIKLKGIVKPIKRTVIEANKTNFFGR